MSVPSTLPLDGLMPHETWVVYQCTSTTGMQHRCISITSRSNIETPPIKGVVGQHINTCMPAGCCCQCGAAQPTPHSWACLLPCAALSVDLLWHLISNYLDIASTSGCREWPLLAGANGRT